MDITLPRKQRVPLPRWLKKELPSSPEYFRTRTLLKELGLQTICEEARCPNQGECWSKNHATVMILGPNCTRTCGFCSVPKGPTTRVDPEEPLRLAEAIQQLGLKYVVITSVNRDDLPDGGAAQFAACIASLRVRLPETKVEILTPDFQFSLERSIEAFQDHLPDVWAHNIETVDRLSRKARVKGSHKATLMCLKAIKERYPQVPTKSGIMLGMGEQEGEVEETLTRLRSVGVSHITVGQYLRPTPHHMPVKEFIPPERFEAWRQRCAELGYTAIECHPYARSSYISSS
ncbi:lipoyl synthase [bacterium]|nr:MAG: Lipoyl synthase [Candidatus Hinthialibacteria bacterium OLB16]MBK7496630.1 lipoyl synthase [Candidatus Omnitrophota bacterium]MCK6497512.1 lipoyl synthase [bacterium]